MKGLLNTAIKAARIAGDIIYKGLHRLEHIEIQEKQQNNFVTEIDKLAEENIINTIKRVFPSHSIIAEESGSHEGDEYTWIIDPLDGTRNYIHGIPHFATSIAVSVKNQLEIAVIFDPFKNELFIAHRGGGAQLNNRKLRVSKITHLKYGLIGTAASNINDELLQKHLQEYNKISLQTSGIRRTGSVALDLAYVAAGRLDGLWASNMHIWDIAAGILLVFEAGGIVTDLHGGKTYLNTGDLIAGNSRIHKNLHSTLNQE